MAQNEPLSIDITYDADHLRGTFSVADNNTNTVWDRIRQSAAAATEDYSFTPTSITVPWPAALAVIREYAQNQNGRSVFDRIRRQSKAFTNLSLNTGRFGRQEPSRRAKSQMKRLNDA